MELQRIILKKDAQKKVIQILPKEVIYEEFKLRLSDIIESQEELERVLNDISDTRIIAKQKRSHSKRERS